jgi:hypothetical protein
MKERAIVITGCTESKEVLATVRGWSFTRDPPAYLGGFWYTFTKDFNFNITDVGMKRDRHDI